MGRGIKAGKTKKVNLNGITRQDIKDAQEKINKDIAKHDVINACDATIAVQVMYFNALIEEFGFTVDDFKRLSDRLDKLTVITKKRSVRGADGVIEYPYYNSLCKVLEDKGIEVLRYETK